MYPLGSNLLVFASANGTGKAFFPTGQVAFPRSNDGIPININGVYAFNFTPAQFLDINGNPYGTTIDAAKAAFQTVLQNAVSSVSAGTAAVSATSTSFTTNSAGTIPAGAYMISIAVAGAGAGTIDGVIYTFGTTFTLPAVAGTKYSALSYDATNTEFKILYTH